MRFLMGQLGSSEIRQVIIGFPVSVRLRSKMQAVENEEPLVFGYISSLLKRGAKIDQQNKVRSRTEAALTSCLCRLAIHAFQLQFRSHLRSRVAHIFVNSFADRTVLRKSQSTCYRIKRILAFQ